MKKGFTLIELLVVIAILAVLATATVLVLNPAELLKQGRDSTRISDLAALNSALSLWVSDVLNGQSAIAWDNAGGTGGKWGNNDYVYCTGSSTLATNVWASGACSVNATTTVTDGKGWVPLNFGLIAAGSPLAKLPLDPNNTSTNCSLGTPAICEYVLHVSSTIGIYKLATQMESAKFKTGGSAHITDNDGGSSPNWYEVGSNLSSW